MGEVERERERERAREKETELLASPSLYFCIYCALLLRRSDAKTINISAD